MLATKCIFATTFFIVQAAFAAADPDRTGSTLFTTSLLPTTTLCFVLMFRFYNI